ncbi:protein kinase [Candidatus Uabimicrobium sp. HlEnr_7]|uniref:protein kinase domain-containing protein n=1 Tax=Candidatus Uabimicrobium helgolandensis TaxID=3095367 RepID=UPI00355803B7
MHGKLLFLQKAVSLNYLPQQKLSELLKLYGTTIPENIEDILIDQQILTEEQVRTVYNKIEIQKEVARLDQTISEDETIKAGDSLIIANETQSDMSEGSHLDVSYVSNNDNIIDFSEDSQGAPLHLTMPEGNSQEQNLHQTMPEALQKNIPLDVTMAAGNEYSTEQPSLDLTMAANDKGLSENLPLDLTMAANDKSLSENLPLDITMPAIGEGAPVEQVKPTTSFDMTVTDNEQDSIISTSDKISFHTLSDFERGKISAQLPQAGSSEDMAVAQKAVEQKKISVSDLQSCMKEKQSLSQTGNNISICQLLLERDVLSPSEILSLMKEKKTEPAVVATAGQHFAPGQVLADKFRVEKKLGSGGMGAVYKVQHTMMSNRYFALKIMHSNIAANENNYRRFVREVEATMSVMHRNIIPVREFGRLENGSPYLTMDCSTGQPLDEILQKNWNKDIPRSLEITKQILQGLEEAHNKSIIHRDLKPANILVEKDEQQKDLIKIVDFGLAKLVEESEIESITQGAIGTPFYMSPQQAGGEKVDHCTDIYAVGVILYEMTTGSLPFKSNTLRELLKKQMFELPDPPKTVRPDLPDNLERIILKALSKPVEERYQNCAEFIADIDRFLGGEKVEAKKVRNKNSKPLLAIAATIVIIGVGTIGYFAMFNKNTAPAGESGTAGTSNQQINNTNNSERFKAFEGKINIYLQQKLWQEARSILTQTVNMNLSVEQVNKVSEYRRLIDRKIQEQLDYQTLTTSVNIARNQQQFEKAIALLTAYQKSHPNNSYEETIKQQLKNIKDFRKQNEQQQQLQEEYQFSTAKNELLSLVQQKLWQAAYKALLDLEKLPVPNKKAESEISEVKTKIVQRLNEAREYEKTKVSTELQQSKKQYKEALHLWQTYKKKHPNSEYRQQVQQKISYLIELQKANNKSEQQQLIRDAQNALKNRMYKKAQELCRKALKINSKSKSALLCLGKAYYYQKQYKKAVKPLVIANDHHSETYYMLARIYLRKSQKKAIFYLEKSITAAKREGNKKNIVSRSITLGELYEKKRQTTRALQTYTTVLGYIEKQRSQKKYLDLFRKVGMMLYTAGKTDEAGKHLKIYQNLGGNNSRVNEIMIQFTNYTPLNFNSKWKYRTSINNNNSYNTYIIAAIQNDEYLIKVDGRVGDERWYKKDGYMVKKFRNGTTDKVLKYPPKKQMTWTSELPRYKVEYRIVSVSEKIQVPAGTFDNCIKLELKYSNNSQRYSFIYYAPEVGEVKQEKYLNGQKIFTKELIEYSH